VHPLHIAVKREYTDCIAFLMGRDLPLDKVKEELGWACQFDLSQSVYCLLENGAPHALLDLPYISPTSRLYLPYISPARGRCAARAAQDPGLARLGYTGHGSPETMAAPTMAILMCRRAAWAARALPVDQQLAPAAKLKGLLAPARLLLGAPRPQRRSRYRSRSGRSSYSSQRARIR